MLDNHPETETLIERACQGDDEAASRLLAIHRGRLQRMVSVRMDRRLSKRVDASDVVQETLAEAARRMGAYLNDRRVPFFAWLRGICHDRLINLYHHHVSAQKRSVIREFQAEAALPDESVWKLIEQVAGDDTSPSGRAMNREDQARMLTAMAQLESRDRDLLIMRYLEQISVKEAAELLGISRGAVKMRCLRALERLRELLGDEQPAGVEP